MQVTIIFKKRLFVNSWGKSEKMKESRWWQSDYHLFVFKIFGNIVEHGNYARLIDEAGAFAKLCLVKVVD